MTKLYIEIDKNNEPLINGRPYPKSEILDLFIDFNNNGIIPNVHEIPDDVEFTKEETDGYVSYVYKQGEELLDISFGKPVKSEDISSLQYEKERLESTFRIRYDLYSKKRQRVVKARKTKKNLLALLIVLIGATAGVAYYNSPQVQTSIAIDKLNTEIEKHTNHFEIEGHRGSLSSHLSSETCYVPKLDENDTWEERIERYCEEYNLGDEVCEAAIQKFELGYNDEPEFWDIDLSKVYKSSQNVKKQ